MRIANIVKVDSKGRITIPLVIREALDIREGRHLIVVADMSKREILLTPIASGDKMVYEIKVELKDQPGALATFSNKLKDLGLNQLIVKCSTLKRGEIGECISLVEPVASREVDVDKVKRELEKLDVVYYLSVKPLEVTVA
uniref:AbrB family transcriptional regulator n=1 Tax=Fervidicoccus fontis TaxID=683846 RepID=A0A7J3ZKQ6_9CREN